MNRFRFFHIAAYIIALMLNACAHPITINPSSTPVRVEEQLYSKKVVGYVMTEADRTIQVTTEGGGGDKASYFPYKDLEKGIRDALRSLYSDVVSLHSPSDVVAIQRDQIAFVFAPEIHTSSSSDGLFTWMPTHFSVDLSFTVTDQAGTILSRVRAVGQGVAPFSENQHDFGLAGRRAAQNALEKFVFEVRANPRLR